jgi:hypothetical protein
VGHRHAEEILVVISSFLDALGSEPTALLFNLVVPPAPAYRYHYILLFVIPANHSTYYTRSLSIPLASTKHVLSRSQRSVFRRNERDGHYGGTVHEIHRIGPKECPHPGNWTTFSVAIAACDSEFYSCDSFPPIIQTTRLTNPFVSSSPPAVMNTSVRSTKNT